MPPTPCRGVAVPASCADGGLMARPGVEAVAPGVGFGWLGEAVGSGLLGCRGALEGGLGGGAEPVDGGGGGPDGEGGGVAGWEGVGVAMAGSRARTAWAWSLRLAGSGR